MVGSGQKQKVQPQEVDPNESASNSSSSRNNLLTSGTQIEGRLQKSVDVKKANIGDQVVLKTTKSIKQNGRTLVPKGASLIGRVTEVQQRTKANGTSRLGMVFDRLENKGMMTPINVSITSIANISSNADVGDLASTDMIGSGSSSTRTSGGGSTGGGLLGGVTGAAGGVLNTTTQTLGGVTNAAGSTIGTTTEMVSQTVNGIQISNALNGSAQSGSSLSAANRNIRLEKGVMLQLTLNSSVQIQ